MTTSLSSSSSSSSSTTVSSYGPTNFSVVPRSAAGYVSIRYVPRQTAAQLVACLRRHVSRVFAETGSSNVVDVSVRSSSSWWVADAGSALIQCAEVAMERVWGMRPLHVQEGGTMPVAAELENLLNAPAVLLPFGQSSDQTHLPNERMRVLNLARGRDVVKEMLFEMGKRGILLLPTQTQKGAETEIHSSSQKGTGTGTGAPETLIGGGEYYPPRRTGDPTTHSVIHDGE